MNNTRSEAFLEALEEFHPQQLQLFVVEGAEKGSILSSYKGNVGVILPFSRGLGKEEIVVWLKGSFGEIGFDRLDVLSKIYTRPMRESEYVKIYPVMRDEVEKDKSSNG